MKSGDSSATGVHANGGGFIGGQVDNACWLVYAAHEETISFSRWDGLSVVFGGKPSVCGHGGLEKAMGRGGGWRCREGVDKCLIHTSF